MDQILWQNNIKILIHHSKNNRKVHRKINFINQIYNKYNKITTQENSISTIQLKDHLMYLQIQSII